MQPLGHTSLSVIAGVAQATSFRNNILVSAVLLAPQGFDNF